MKKTLLLMFAFVASLTTAFANETKATPTLGVIAEETFALDLGKFTVENKVIDTTVVKTLWGFNTPKYPCAKGTSYSKGKPKTASEGWLISPVIDLAGATNTFLTFEHAANYFTVKKGGASYFADCCTVKVREENGTWTDLKRAHDPSGSSFTYEKDTADLKVFDGKKIQIAYVYTSNDSVAGTWQVKNFRVEGMLEKAPVVVAVPTIEPAAGVYSDSVKVSIKAEAGLKVYYSLDGKEPAIVDANLYSAPFTLKENATVVAVAVDAEGNVSSTAVANYQIKKSPVAPANGALYDFNKNQWNLPISNSTENFEIKDTLVEAGVTFYPTSGSTTTRIWNDKNNGLQLRVYTGGTLNFVAPAGKEFQKIEFNVSQEKKPMTVNHGTYANKVWEGNATSLVFNVNGTTNINYIMITLGTDTAIEGVEANQNKQVIIYSLDGRRLNQAVKGINIINGKKVLVK